MSGNSQPGPKGPSTPESPTPSSLGRGQTMESRIFAKTRKNQVTQKRMEEKKEDVPGKTSLDPSFDSPLPTGTPRFYAGKRVSGEGLSPKTPGSRGAPLLEMTGSLSSAPDREGPGAAPGWGASLSMLEDIGWSSVMPRVKSYFSDLGIRETAEAFNSRDLPLTEKILDMFVDSSLSDSTFCQEDYFQSVEEAAVALSAYIVSHREG